MTKRLFISYSHKDGRYLDRLHVHLAQAMREGVFQGWFDREIAAGGDIDANVARELDLAQIFIALVSPDFIASDYCYDKELACALDRRSGGTMVVVPVIVEPCDWQSSPLGKLKALPTDGKAVAEWTNENVAFVDVVRGLRTLAIKLDPIEVKSAAPAAHAETTPPRPSAKYKVQKRFGQIDKEEFADNAFAAIQRFFEESAREINSVDGLRAKFRIHSPTKFSCAVENSALNRAEEVWVRRGGMMGEITIAYNQHGRDPGDNTSNGGFAVDADDYELFLASRLFNFRGDSERLDAIGAAKILFDDLLQHVGIQSA